MMLARRRSGQMRAVQRRRNDFNIAGANNESMPMH